MSVKVGSARSSYGNTRAGDQHSGMEVSTQDWYQHSKGWRVLVCKYANGNAYIAEAMRKACANDDIGYDQSTRGTLYSNVKAAGFDPSKTTKKVNTDCSALVRVCVSYAFRQLGIDKIVPDFITSDEASTLLKTGYFEELKGTKYTTESDYLPKGAILVTKTKGHTVVVLNDGPKCDAMFAVLEAKRTTALGDRELSYGDEGEDVKELQAALIQLGYEVGAWGCDGEWGDCTEMAVREFQTSNALEIDGIVGVKTLGALHDALERSEAGGGGKSVRIVGGNCYVRRGAGTSFDEIAVARKGDVLPLIEVAVNGWCRVRYGVEADGWVSGKYAEIL